MLYPGMKSSSLSLFLYRLLHGCSTSPGCFIVLKGSCCLVLVELHDLTASRRTCRVVNSELDLKCHLHVCTNMSCLLFDPDGRGLLCYFTHFTWFSCLCKQLVALYDRVSSLVKSIA